MAPDKAFHLDASHETTHAMGQNEIPAFPADLCVTDRRESGRRQQQIPVAVERRSGKGQRQERGGRRHRIDPTTCERNYNSDEIIFMKAMDQYKRDNRRQFPTWSEVLEVLRALGYRKVAEPARMPGLCGGMPPSLEA